MVISTSLIISLFIIHFIKILLLLFTEKKNIFDKNVPIITSRNLDFPPKVLSPRQIWVDNLDTLEENKLGLVDLHPEIFACSPRIDLVHLNTTWQNNYKRVVRTRNI